MRIFILISFVSSILLNAQVNNMIFIIPEPQSIAAKALKFKISSTTRIVLGSGNAAEQFIAQQFNDEFAALNQTPLKVTDEQSVRKLTSNYIFIGKPSTEYGKKFLRERKGTLTSELKTEGYFLDVDAKGVVIIAESDKGLFYGTMSLIQMLDRNKRSLTVAGVTIHDYPMQKIRGISDDISRGQISTLENFKKIIRFCARYKMNVYSPYIEDVFVFKKHPEIGKNRGALTPAECKELDAYAKKYFVEMIPIFETLGHWENILLLPEYLKLAEFPGAHTLNVSDEKVYSLLDEMIGEIASSFSSPYFNMAADESWDVGLGINKERVKKSDLATVHAEHYKRVFEIVKKHGKKPIMYGDIVLQHPEIMKKIPRDVVMVDWHYGPSLQYTSPSIFKESGFPYIVSPAVWCFTGPYPDYTNSILNIYNLNLEGYSNQSMGMICSSWNDHGGEALRELNYYGYAWGAECSWNPMHAQQLQFNKKYFRDQFGTNDIDDLQSIYSIFNSPSVQYHWYELWRHPMLQSFYDVVGESKLPLIQRMQTIQSTMPFALELIEKVSKIITRNGEQLRYLSFAAKLHLWFANKLQTEEEIKILLKDSTASKKEIHDSIKRKSGEIVEELMNCRREFEKLWHTTNKPEGLYLLLKRYDRQAAYWNEISAQSEHGAFNPDPTIKSQWIYHPDANPNIKDSVQIPKAYFRKSFSFSKNVRSAKLQLLGDTWATLYVNGKQIGEVYARHSLSLKVENERAKIFDITPFLRDSENVIAVESRNYQENGSAGINIYGEVVFTDGSMEKITTDNSWLVSDSAPANWMKHEFHASSWVLALPKIYPNPVIAPNLSTERTSWFER